MSFIPQGGPRASRGFTLIEMSIVLVIIGLIIGGILKGQEIVNSAREKSVVNQINAVRTATNTYFDHHAALPGDDPQSAYIGLGMANGDGNGLIGTALTLATVASGINTATTTAAGENLDFFAALSNEGLLKDSTPATAAIAPKNFGAVNGSLLPATAFPQSGLGVFTSPHAGYATTDPQSPLLSANWLTVWSFTNTGGYSPRVAGHIDTEMDDGIADTGTVRGDDTTCNKNGTGYIGANATIVAATNIDQPTCTQMFQLVAD